MERTHFHHSDGVHPGQVLLPQVDPNPSAMVEPIAQFRPGHPLVPGLEVAVHRGHHPSAQHQGKLPQGAGTDAAFHWHNDRFVGFIFSFHLDGGTDGHDTAATEASLPAGCPCGRIADAGIQRAGVAEMRRKGDHLCADARQTGNGQTGLPSWEAVLLHRPVGVHC